MNPAVPFSIIGGVLLFLYLFTRKELFEVVTTRVSAGDFCASEIAPSGLGIAPEWAGFAQQVRWFVDPVTGCAVPNTPEMLRLAPIIVLSNREQVARFLSLNGSVAARTPSTFPAQPVAGSILGPAIPNIYSSGPAWSCPQGTHVESRGGENVCVWGEF